MLDLFEKYRLKEESLLDYGFVRSGAEYSYSTEIMAGDFQIDVLIFDGKLDFQVLDLDTGDEYRQVKMESMAGEFVGQVKAACQEVLLDIRQHCFEEVGFLYEQSQRLSSYVATTYQGQLEYLWENSSRKGSNRAAVFRHQDSKKWYGAFLVLNVKSDRVTELIQQKGIYPAFHMNKKYWLSLPLDGTLPDQQLFDLLDTSFVLTKKR